MHRIFMQSIAAAAALLVGGGAYAFDVSIVAGESRSGAWDGNVWVPSAADSAVSRDEVMARLAAGSVTVSADDGALTVSAPLAWSTNTLTLFAAGDVTVDAPMDLTGTAGLSLVYGQGDVAGGFRSLPNQAAFLARAPVNLTTGNTFSTTVGSDGVPIDYTVITTLGAAGSTTGTDLQGIEGDLDGNYVLGNDIDASATAAWEWSSGFGPHTGFRPIGTITAPFTGRFDGLGHAIDGLTIHGRIYIGLFGVVRAASLFNIGLTDVEITGNAAVGALVGRSQGVAPPPDGSGAYAAPAQVTTLRNVRVEGGRVGTPIPPVSGITQDIGGLMGNQDGPFTRILSSRASVDVDVFASPTARSQYVGGLVGNSLGDIVDSHAGGNVTGGWNGVGGLVGRASAGASYQDNIHGTTYYYGGEILRSYATGDVTSRIEPTEAFRASDTGGLVGEMISNGVVLLTESFATGNVSGRDAVGGVIGASRSISIGGPVVYGTYATGSVSGWDYVGGLGGDISTGGIIFELNYTASPISATGANVGGLFGRFNSNVQSGNSWDLDTTGQAVAVADPFSVDEFRMNGLTTVQMRSFSSYQHVGGPAYGWYPGEYGLTPAGGDNTRFRLYDGHTYPLLRRLLKPLTLVFEDRVVAYTGAPQTVTATYHASADHDPSQILGSPATASATATDIGTYPMTAPDLYSTQFGYDLILVPGTLTIAAPVGIVSFSATPATIEPGEDSTLAWNTTHATACSITNDAGDPAHVVAPGDIASGTLIVSPDVDTSYTLSCEGATGKVTATVMVDVNGPRPPLIFADGFEVVAGR